MLVAGWWMLYLYGHRVGRFQCEVRRADVAIRVPQSFEGYRIVHISDLHLDGWFGHADLLRKRVEQINALRPDLVCFTGDLVSLSSQEIDPFVPILKGIHARDGVVSVLGNHDYLPYARHLSPKERQLEVERIIHTQREQLGWKLLLNDHITVTRAGESLAILGCENHSGYDTHPADPRPQSLACGGGGPNRHCAHTLRPHSRHAVAHIGAHALQFSFPRMRWSL